MFKGLVVVVVGGDSSACTKVYSFIRLILAKVFPFRF